MKGMNDSSEVVWTGMKTKVLLTPMMIHNHKFLVLNFILFSDTNMSSLFGTEA